MTALCNAGKGSSVR